MRRSYISPEYLNNNVYGTFNMVEESNFFGSKMLDVEDSLYCEKQDIIWYQKLNGEQLDYSIESSLQSYVQSTSDNKKNNHTLIIDDSQASYQLNKDTRWILDINLNEILSSYLYATLKKHRTFEGVKNEMVISKDVNVALKTYIKNNILDRYKYKSIDFFIKYRDLRDQSLLRYKNNWNPNLTSDNKFNKLQTEKEFNDSKIRLIFNQEKASEDFVFDYYFNILFEKI